MAAGSTYTPIATQTASGSASTIVFSSIPSTYTDLIMIINSGTSNSNYDLNLRLNGDSGSNYSQTNLRGNGSSASSSRGTNATLFYMDDQGNTVTGSINGMYIVHINNYSNTTTYKTMLSRAGFAGGTATELNVSLWRSTSAINQLTIGTNAGNIYTGSTFTLYGITAA